MSAKTKARKANKLNRVIFDRDISDRQKWINRDWLVTNEYLLKM